MADIGTATTNSEDQPIWVQDLEAWLAKISGKNLTGEQWAVQVQELLAELPGQGLPEKYWVKAKENAEAAESTQEAEVQKLFLSDEHRAKIQKELEDVAKIKDEDDRWRSLGKVAAKIPAFETNLLQQALDVTLTFGDDRWMALCQIVPRIPAFETHLLQQALDVALTINHGSASALEYLAAQIPASEIQMLQQVIDALHRNRLEKEQSEYRNDYELTRALVSIADKLTTAEPKLFQQALETAQAILNDDYVDEALVAVAARMPFSKRQYVLKKALDVAQNFHNGAALSNALAVVAAHLPASRERYSTFKKALDAAQVFMREDVQSEALAVVATHLPTSKKRHSTFQKAIQVALESLRIDGFQDPLVAVAAKLPASESKLLEQVLEVGRLKLNVNYLSKLFVAVAPQLPTLEDCRSLLQEALKEALPMDCRSEVLLALAIQLPTLDDRRSLLQEAIQIALSFESKQERIKALTNIAFQSTEFLILHLSQTHLSTALEIIPEGKSSADKAKLLSALAPHLSVGLFPRTLQLIQFEITHPAYQAECLGNLAPYLSTEQLSEALDIVQNHVVGFSYFTTALCNLIPRLSRPLLQKALHIADTRITIPYSALWTQILQTTAKRLNTIADIQAQADDQIVKNQLIQDILDRTHQKISDEKSIATIITALATSLNSDDDDQFAEILQGIISKIINSEFYLAQALAAIVPKLSSKKIADFSTQAESLRQERPRAIALSAFISHYPDNLPKSIINLQQKSSDPIRDTDIALIFASRPHPKSKAQLAQLAQDQTNVLRLIRDRSYDVDKASYLVKLAPHLLTSQSLDVQSITLDIQDAYHKARSLLALATHFPEIRADAQRQIEQVKSKKPERDEYKDKYLILHIELLSQFATTVPGQIPSLLKTIEDWAHQNQFKEDLKEPVRRTYKRRRILIALKPHLPIRLVREIDRQTSIGKAPKDLWERALFVLRNEYRQALKTGSLRNDATQDEDLLNLKDEINALTEMLLMRDLEPPVAVGILGGWGGGKSYIMHLMQTHMVAIRSQGMEAIEAWGFKDDKKNTSPDGDRVGRFVGHIYQIKFDAWTYAKSNLWASLMQTIFFELDRQIAIEQQLAKELAEEPDNPASLAKVFLTAGQYWSVLYKANEDDRAYFLEKVLPKEKFDAIQDPKLLTADSILWDKFLWEQYDKVKDTDQQQLAHQKKRRTDIEAQKAQKEEEIKAITKNIEEIQQKQDERKVKLQATATNEVTKAIDSALQISKIILIKRLGEPVFEAIRNQVETELKQQNINTEEIGDLRDSAIGIVTKILEEGKVQQTEAGKPVKTFDLDRQAWRRWAIKNIWPIVGFIVLSLIAIALPIILQHVDGIGAQIAGLIVPLVPAIGLTQKLMRSSQKWYGQVEAVLSEYGKQVEDFEQKQQQSAKVLEERLQHDQQLKQWSSEAVQLGTEQQALTQSLETLKQETAELDRDIKETEESIPKDVYGSLQNFVRSRIEDSSYDKHLGLMHQIKDDLWKLSNGLLPPANASEFKTKLDKLKQVFPRGPARVVVYIDDLDRCPPNTVVEVLEAVQLLVKNPLFIAVLAIDERYINRALAQHYKGVLSLQGSPSAADYLEKIIQIPYRVRPIAEDALRAYLRAQTVVQDSETSGTKFNEFSPQEFNRLVACCQEVELSPRSLKRLTNVYKLYKILSRTRGQRPTPREQQAILTLLAFSSRYPDLMRDILQEIGSYYEEGRHHKEEDNETLANTFDISLNKYENISEDNPLAQDAKKLRHDVEKLVEEDLKLNEIHDIFTFVRTFSFVGDIGIDITGFPMGDHSIQIPPHNIALNRNGV